MDSVSSHRYGQYIYFVNHLLCVRQLCFWYEGCVVFEKFDWNLGCDV